MRYRCWWTTCAAAPCLGFSARTGGDEPWPFAEMSILGARCSEVCLRAGKSLVVPGDGTILSAGAAQLRASPCLGCPAPYGQARAGAALGRAFLR